MRAESGELESDGHVFLSSFFHLTGDATREWNEAVGINLPIPAIRMIGGSRPPRGSIELAPTLSQHFGKVGKSKASPEAATGGEA